MLHGYCVFGNFHKTLAKTVAVEEVRSQSYPTHLALIKNKMMKIIKKF